MQRGLAKGLLEIPLALALVAVVTEKRRMRRHTPPLLRKVESFHCDLPV
jgi:hypothetical protein